MDTDFQNTFTKAMQISILHFVSSVLIPRKHLFVESQQQKH